MARRKEIAVGDVVVLKSGGPDMTVSWMGAESDDEREAIVRWWDEGCGESPGQIREDTLPVVCLRHAEDYQ